jgi:hypothetical protein
MKIKTNELIGAPLDFMVAKSIGRKVQSSCGAVYWPELCSFSPSTTWEQGGPLIEEGKMRLHCSTNGVWWASDVEYPHYLSSGETPLISAMRCLINRAVGEEVEVPDELIVD